MGAGGGGGGEGSDDGPPRLHAVGMGKVVVGRPLSGWGSQRPHSVATFLQVAGPLSMAGSSSPLARPRLLRWACGGHPGSRSTLPRQGKATGTEAQSTDPGEGQAAAGEGAGQ